MNTPARLVPLLLALMHLAKSQLSKDAGRGANSGGVPIRQYHVGGKCFIRTSPQNKRYLFGKSNKIVTKYKTNFSRKDVQNLLKKIPQINYPLLSAPLGALLRLSNIFAFMLSLNALKLVKNEHRNALIDITDNINSRIFLLNAIGDVVRKIPEEAPQLCKISLFCVAQFCTQFFFSRLTAYLFYSREERGVTTGGGDNGGVQVGRECQGELHTDGERERIAPTAGGTPQEGKKSTMTTGLNCPKGAIHEEEAGKTAIRVENAGKRATHEEEVGMRQKENMLQHMCVLNQSGLIPIYVYNSLSKRLHCGEKNISLFVNCYVLISGILSKIYVKFFVKKKKKDISSDEMKDTCLSSMCSSILRNSYFCILCISIFFKFFNKANAFYEQSIRPSTAMFNAMLTPSVYLILSNILYEGIKLPSPVSFKDLLFVLQNKYLLFPSLIWAMLHVSNRYGVFKFDKSLQLYFLVQAMTPPNYNLFLLAKNYGGSNSIRKILSVSYPMYLVALYFYVLALFSYFRN
ncbi:apicoplast integral membrane protein, putative [Plasmodium vivax]|uniref:Apicoplast integral membrane protein, putative n=1 Tax=Plasmodium vivax TaxID=5855 RepID=A0A564ZU32_PLAVI|nr:apicoplast integral membrane protein, putative [Plasmodium vivax]